MLILYGEKLLVDTNVQRMELIWALTASDFRIGCKLILSISFLI